MTWGGCPSTDGNITANSTFQELSPAKEVPMTLTSEGLKYAACSDRFTLPDFDVLQHI